jgi:hypothetical protein
MAQLMLQGMQGLRKVPRLDRQDPGSIKEGVEMKSFAKRRKTRMDAFAEANANFGGRSGVCHQNRSKKEAEVTKRARFWGMKRECDLAQKRRLNLRPIQDGLDYWEEHGLRAVRMVRPRPRWGSTK